jgi:hypothetical protein
MVKPDEPLDVVPAVRSLQVDVSSLQKIVAGLEARLQALERPEAVKAPREPGTRAK